MKIIKLREKRSLWTRLFHQLIWKLTEYLKKIWFESLLMSNVGMFWAQYANVLLRLRHENVPKISPPTIWNVWILTLSHTHNIVLKAALILTQLNDATLFRCAFVFFVITASTGLMRQYWIRFKFSLGSAFECKPYSQHLKIRTSVFQNYNISH